MIELSEPTSLQRYLEYLKAKRRAQQFWLDQQGMNWDDLKRLRSEAEGEMLALGGNPIQIDGFVATIEQKVIHQIPADAKTVATEYRISLHSKR